MLVVDLFFLIGTAANIERIKDYNMNRPVFPELLTVKDVAEVLNCTQATVRNMIRRGDIDARPLPNKSGKRTQYRIPITELRFYRGEEPMQESRKFTRG